MRDPKDTTLEKVVIGSKEYPRAKLLKKTEEWDDLLAQHKISQKESEVMESILERAPTEAELGVFSSMWSEHCSYKSSRFHLKRLPTSGKHVVVGPGENAGVVHISGSLCVAFKMESHNHPSYIEPYQGAATGVGGILRDVFCMGARPIANLNSLRFGQKKHPRTPYLFDKVVKGIGDYGNCVGIPTVAGSTSFHPSYDGNCLVNAMTVGLIDKERIFKGFASGHGNLVVYVGSATGRDGVRGATMASGSFSGQKRESKTTVQVGDPFAEKQLLEATLDMLERNLVLGLQDMGAAGLTSSAFEMADRAGSGLLIDLDKVPVRADKMSAYELLLSESQERMLLCVEPDKWQSLADCLKRWELPFAVIGQVTDSGRVQIIYRDHLEVDVPVKPLVSNAPVYQRPTIAPSNTDSDRMLVERQLNEYLAGVVCKNDLNQVLALLLSDSGSPQPIYDQFDHHIGVRTVLGPDSGGAALLSLHSELLSDQDENLGLSVSVACNERYCGVDSKIGASHAVLKAARAIVATGAQPLAVTDCLNYGNPEDPKVMYEISSGIDGIAEACLAIETPVVSGNVSLYNETDGSSILPTPMIGMVGVHKHIDYATGAIFKEQEGFVLALVPKVIEKRWGGSLMAHVFAFESALSASAIPVNYNAEKEAFVLIRQFCEHNLLAACRDIGEGGLLITLLKMLLATELSFSGEFAANMTDREKIKAYFGEFAPGYILQITSQTNLEEAQDLVSNSSEFDLLMIGKTHRDANGTFTIDKQNLDLSTLRSSYQQSLQF